MYLEYRFHVNPQIPGTEILIAELAEQGFESFFETDQGVLAYVKSDIWTETLLESIQILRNPEFEISHSKKELRQENWNAVWESNFEPIQVGDQCFVRAPFHAKSKAPYDIVIEPKMSFGTGHHETTYLMLQLMLDIDFKDLSVLDMGCGTGVLAILAALKEAVAVDAVDIDEWSYHNSKENIERNQCNQINVYLGDTTVVPTKGYEVVLANINRNTLLSQIPTYASLMGETGQLLLSGFYSEDLPLISEHCKKVGLRFVEQREKHNWVAAIFSR